MTVCGDYIIFYIDTVFYVERGKQIIFFLPSKIFISNENRMKKSGDHFPQTCSTVLRTPIDLLP